MCVKPIRIPNPSTRFDPYFDKVLIEVPCGHCGECRAKRISDLCCRAYMEWQHCKNLGGYCLLHSFTYSPENAPSYRGILTFNREHYILLMKRVRQQMLRDGFDSKDIKILWTSEYGDDTCRPHYHAAIFCSNPSIPEYYLSKLFDEKWTFGFTEHTSKKTISERIVNSVAGLFYACKYVGKSHEYERILKEQRDRCRSWDEYNELFPSDIMKALAPFTRISRGFGLDGLQFLYESQKDNIMETGCVTMPYEQGEKNKGKGFSVVTLPLYYQRKLFYYLDENKCYRLNCQGFLRKKKQTLDNIDRIESKIEQFFKINDYETIVDKVFTDYAESLMQRPYISYRDFMCYIDDMFESNGYTYRDLSEFIVLRSFRLSLGDPVFTLSDSISFNRPSVYSTVRYNELRAYTRPSSKNPFLTNNNEIILGQLTDLYFLLNSLIQQQKQKEYEQKQSLAREAAKVFRKSCIHY